MNFCSIDLDSPRVKEFISSLSDLGESEVRIKNLINLWRNKTRNYDGLPTRNETIKLLNDTSSFKLKDDIQVKNNNLRVSFKTSQQRQDRILLISRLFSQIVNKKVGSNADTKTRANNSKPI